MRFQKLTRNLFLTLHGHNAHRQQQQLSKFLMCYLQFGSHAYCGDSFQDGVAAGKGFLCVPFEVSRSVITVQREFRARSPCRCVFSKACTKLPLHCNHSYGEINFLLTFETAPFFCVYLYIVERSNVRIYLDNRKH